MKKYLVTLHDTIRDLKFGKLNKEFLIFIFFLVLSATFWFINTMNETYETEVIVPVKLTKVPSNIVITTDIQDSLHVTVRGNGFSLLKYMFNNEAKPIYVKFDDYNTTEYSGTISTSSLSRLLLSRFKNVNISSVKPDRLEFYYNYGKHKRVPVRLEGNVTAAESYYISGYKFMPDSVTVYAIESILDSIHYAPTRLLNISNLSDTLRMDVALASIKGVKFEPNIVKIGLYPDIYSEGSLDIPITCINLPAGKTLRTFPSKATVRFVAGLKDMRSISPSDFVVETDYADFSTDTTSTKCHIILRSVPDNVNRATLTINDVEYLIEE